MEKTTKHLNEKWWHRLMKVVYIMIFIIITLIFSFIVIAETKPNKKFDWDKSYIQCDDGRSEGLGKNDIYLNKQGFVPTEVDEKIRLLCSHDPKNPPKLENGKKSLEEIAYDAGVAPLKNNYSIIARYETVGSWRSTILYLTITFLIVCGFFEIFRRVYYFIVLGTIKPVKK